MIDNVTGFQIVFSPLRQALYETGEILGSYKKLEESLIEKLQSDLNLSTSNRQEIGRKIVEVLYKYKNEHGSIMISSNSLKDIKELPSLEFIYEKYIYDGFMRKELLLYFILLGLEVDFKGQYKRTFILNNFVNESVINIQFCDKEYEPYVINFEYNNDDDSINNILMHTYLENKGYETMDPDKGLEGLPDIFKYKYTSIVNELISAFNYELTKEEVIREFSSFFFKLAELEGFVTINIDSNFVANNKIPFLLENNFFTRAFGGNKLYTIDKQIIEYLIWFGDDQELYLNNIFNMNGTEEPYIELIINTMKFDEDNDPTYAYYSDGDDDYYEEEDDDDDYEDYSLDAQRYRYSQEKREEYRKKQEEEEEEERQRQEDLDDLIFMMLLEEEEEW